MNNRSKMTIVRDRWRRYWDILTHPVEEMHTRWRGDENVHSRPCGRLMDSEGWTIHESLPAHATNCKCVCHKQRTETLARYALKRLNDEDLTAHEINRDMLESWGMPYDEPDPTSWT